MRTKTLLIAAAALVAATVSSEAQVYSANIVGYVNVYMPGNGQYQLVANPFDDGNGNHLSNIITAPLPANSVCTIYTPGVGPSSVNRGGSPVHWSTDVVLPPGTGFFIRNGAVGGGAPDVTNTFVGSVVPAVGNSVTNQIPVGFSLQGSTIAYAGNIAISGVPNGDPTMDYGSPLPGLSKITTWNATSGSQGPLTTSKNAAGTKWGGTVPIIPGQGFYLFNAGASATNMVQTLP